MPVSADTQAAISQRYVQLADSITHGNTDTEKSILAVNFSDHNAAKLDSFEYDALTVVVHRIESKGSMLQVHAQYVGVHGHNANSVDLWKQSNGTWVLISRS